MELWVRSQDRELLTKVEGVYYDYQQEKHHITVFTNEDYHWVGTYKSKERALEVLDEIQIIVKWCQKNMKDVTIGDRGKLIGSFNDYVYEIPKE